MEILRRFIAKLGVSVFDATRETVGFFARIKDAFKRTVDPYGSMMDVWIAAHILETGSILITYDKHFAMVPGLGMWNRTFPLKGRSVIPYNMIKLLDISKKMMKSGGNNHGEMYHL